jgi:type IV pilus assembly protein PilA
MTTLNSTLQLALLKQKKRKNVLQKGFTLVELMIVIVIVGILSAVALPNFLNQTNKARATEARTQLSAALKNAQMYVLETGSAGSILKTDIGLVNSSDFGYEITTKDDDSVVIEAVGALAADGVNVTGTLDLNSGKVTLEDVPAQE